MILPTVAHLYARAMNRPDTLPPALYLLRGLRLLFAPGVKRYVAIPFLINVAIFGGLGWWLGSLIGAWLAPPPQALDAGWLARALGWLQHALAWAVTLGAWVALAWLYTVLANIIAAPFNGLLAERVEAHLTGAPPPPGGSVATLIREIPRTLASEASKIVYLVTRFVPLLLLQFIPVLNIVAPFLLFAFGAWVFALEYLDYPMGNHGARFRDVRAAASKRRITALSFGAPIAFVSAVPILNLLVMPAAVAGATALWLDRWQPDADPDAAVGT